MKGEAMADIEKAPTRDDWLTRWIGEWPRWLEMRRPDFWSRLEPELRVEEFREGNELVVRAEMPGIDPDHDVDIHVSNHVLSLRAERRQESKTEEEGRYRSEFHYGSFSRSIPLPNGASEQDVKASYKDGVLEVRIPIDEAKAEKTKVPVQRV
jgi:HSP20 family protein